MSKNLKRFAPNIEKKGRLLRGVAAMALLVGGCVALQFSLFLSGFLLASGLFVLFEALRGWCVFRACDIKTKL